MGIFDDDDEDPAMMAFLALGDEMAQSLQQDAAAAPAPPPVAPSHPARARPTYPALPSAPLRTFLNSTQTCGTLLAYVSASDFS